MEPLLEGWLACPRCGGDLRSDDGGVRCLGCDTHYARENGVLDLVDPAVRVSSEGPGDSTAMAWRRRRWDELRGPVAPESADFLAAIWKILRPDDRVLDLGCGPGSTLAWLTEYAPEVAVLGLDLSFAALDEARRVNQSRPNVAFVRASSRRRLPVRDGSCDVILRRLAPGLPEEIARALAPGGHYLRFTYGPNHWREVYDRLPGLPRAREDTLAGERDRLTALGLVVEDAIHETDLEEFSMPAVLLALRSNPSAFHAERLDLSAVRELWHQGDGRVTYRPLTTEYTVLIARNPAVSRPRVARSEPGASGDSAPLPDRSAAAPRSETAAEKGLPVEDAARSRRTEPTPDADTVQPPSSPTQEQAVETVTAPMSDATGAESLPGTPAAESAPGTEPAASDADAPSATVAATRAPGTGRHDSPAAASPGPAAGASAVAGDLAADTPGAATAVAANIDATALAASDPRDRGDGAALAETGTASDDASAVSPAERGGIGASADTAAPATAAADQAPAAPSTSLGVASVRRASATDDSPAGGGQEAPPGVGETRQTARRAVANSRGAGGGPPTAAAPSDLPAAGTASVVDAPGLPMPASDEPPTRSAGRARRATAGSAAAADVAPNVAAGDLDAAPKPRARRAAAGRKATTSPGQPTSTDNPIPGEPTLTDNPVPGEPTSADNPIPGEPASTDNAIPGEPASTDNPAPGEPASAENPVSAEPASTDNPVAGEPTSIGSAPSAAPSASGGGSASAPEPDDGAPDALEAAGADDATSVARAATAPRRRRSETQAEPPTS